MEREEDGLDVTGTLGERLPVKWNSGSGHGKVFGQSVLRL